MELTPIIQSFRYRSYGARPTTILDNFEIKSTLLFSYVNENSNVLYEYAPKQEHIDFSHFGVFVFLD